MIKVQIFEKSESLRKDLEIISEKTRYKIMLTLFASENPLSFSQLKELLPLTKENQLDHHLKYLKEQNLIKNEKKESYKRDEYRSFYSLNERSLNLFQKLGLNKIKHKFQDLFNKIT